MNACYFSHRQSLQSNNSNNKNNEAPQYIKITLEDGDQSNDSLSMGHKKLKRSILFKMGNLNIGQL
jgi:hypothetical protein